MPALDNATIEALAAKIIGGDKNAQMLPLYLTGTIDSLLLGVVICQVFIYWGYAKTDKKHIVVLVALAVLATSVSSIFVLCWSTEIWIYDFGLYTPFTDFKWMFRFLWLEVATVLVVQIFYVDRACRVFRHWWPSALIGPFVAAGAAFGIATLYKRFAAGKDVFVDEDPSAPPLVYSWLCFVLLSDLLITVTIVYGLSRIKTGFSGTESKLKRAIMIFFESQSPALLSSIVMLAVWDKVFAVAVACGVLQSKIYCCGLLVTLTYRSGSASPSANLYSSTASKNANSYPLGSISADRSNQLQVDIATVDQQDWRRSSRADQHVDIEVAGTKASVEDLTDHEYGSTTGLNRV